MSSKYKEILIMTFLLCLATASAAFALRPLVFRAEKAREIRAGVKTFTSNREKTELEKALDELHEHEQNIKLEEKRAYGNLYKKIQRYNMALYTLKQRDLTSKTAYELSQFALTAYGAPDETFGIITIPAMELEMPLFLGASEENMANGAAVLSQTSIPIGGRDTNAVIAGHRGYGGYDYFRHIDKLEPGDEVIITNLWDTLTYRVTGIKIVSPDDINAILIQPGKDMITLLTCHPYASGGKYRYLVFCERVIE